MRILWVGNGHWVPSGYGEQAGLFVPRLQAAGHDVAVACNFGLQGRKWEVNGTTVYPWPSGGDWNASIPAYAEDHQADLVLILHDAWVLKPHEWPEDMKVAVWAPVDHYPLPPKVLGVLNDDRIRPIAMSRFGKSQMAAFNLDPYYVPHGVDTRLFRPRPDIKAAVRKELGVSEDAFLVGMVAANKGNPSLPRKAFPQAFDAFSRLAKRHDDAFLYCHTEARPTGGGINLDTLARVLGLDSKVRFPADKVWQLGLDKQVVANLYAAFDVLLNCSMGEGFGVPLIEAQASGVPVIASDHSAMSELCQAGWLVGGDPWWDALQDSFFLNPAIDAIDAALEQAYLERDNQELKDAAVAFASGYDADKVMTDHWAPTLEKIGGTREVGPLQVPLQDGLNRAQRRATKRQRVTA